MKTLYSILFSLLFLAHDSSPAEEKLRFNRDIRSILSDNCYHCHGPDEETLEADLRLDSFAEATRDLGGYAGIVPGKPDESEIIFRMEDHDDIMPPSKSKKVVSPEDIATLRKWIEQGAEYEPHWAFLPIEKNEAPQTKQSDWPKNPIDSFILAKLEQEGITPSPEAERSVLIRRLYVDLLGLLPTPEEVEAFLKDSTPTAYEKLVDRLLANPHYGERWGRHWLDQARYADSNGYSVDSERQMWPYRDWVIDAHNQDMPFDQFTIEQIAGDLLENPSKNQLIATAFHRNTLINQEGGTDAEQFRVEAAMDRINTTGAVWLGLTLGCAQCHTHKFDPIQHREYFEMYAFFNQGTDKNNKGKTINVIEGEVFKNRHPSLTSNSSPAQDERDLAKPAKAEIMIMEDLKTPRDTFLLTRGDFTRPNKELGPLYPGGLASVAPPLPAKEGRNRLDLAKWLIHPENPLTPRVTMNRIWMRYFGRGLVETEEDFGIQGTLPSHPQLLDWLAAEFIAQKWSMKAMHRLIVTSASYRQSSHHRSDLKDRDARNHMLARQNRIRFDAEIVRDAALSASGLLSETIGGPSVHPPQPDGVYAFTQAGKKWATESGANRYRRAIYTKFFRSAPYPLFTTFDAPDFSSVCTKRAKSNTPLQALNLANDPVFVEFARSLALRLSNEAPSLSARIDCGFQLCYSRPPSERERDTLTQFVSQTLSHYESQPDAAKALSSPELTKAVGAPAQAATLVNLARALLNTDNFITRE